MDVPVHINDVAGVPCRYRYDGVQFEYAAFGVRLSGKFQELSGKFQLLSTASLCLFVDDKEYNDNLSIAPELGRSQPPTTKRVHLWCLGSWKASANSKQLRL